MAPKFEVKVKSDRIMLRLETLPNNVRNRLKTVAKDLELELLGRAKSRASGEALQVKSGKFVKSIKGSVRSSTRRVSGKVYSKDPRAALFEYGGSTPARDILPSATKAMAFMMTSGQVFAAIVHRPVVHYDARRIIGGAFDEMKGDIQAELAGAVRDGAAES